MIEHHIKNNDLDGLIKAIQKCVQGKDVLLIRDFLKIYNLNDVVNILINQLGFKNDDRQLNLDNNIERSI